MIIVIIGPTASGKTTLVKKIYKYFNNPLIINGDAFQIYQEMNIGTAKISSDDSLFAHYSLLNLKTPDEIYSIRDYQKDFRYAVDKALKDKKDVIVVGGSGLYIRAALFDYKFVDAPSDKNFVLDEKMSNGELHDLLTKKDPVSASKIHPNNRKRVIRALEIFFESGKTKSAIIKEQKHELMYQDVHFFFINPNREQLYQRIENRVEEMFLDGLIDEVKNLLKRYNLSLTAKEAIGYKETIQYLEGKMSLEETKTSIKKRTRNYAKRQITFFKHQFVSEEFKSVEDLEMKIENWRKDNGQ
ncbi:MAG: tRNA (adenosine(37)-N6)-dimethylallyltransferase MiaA [Bacilli bacterium]|jgi:tRNA dimethylallyltransferase|nr:tRNA (adenosine(37)-N6)-dimethylallyltransferase MiaA [Bacilli bacterium]